MHLSYGFPIYLVDKQRSTRLVVHSIPIHDTNSMTYQLYPEITQHNFLY